MLKSSHQPKIREIAIVYICAGISSRFGGKIKQFAKVGPNDEALIEYSLNELLPIGFSRIIFVVGNKTETPFRDFFGDEYRGIPVLYALQKYDEETRDRPWGTTDALCSIRGLIDCPFVVMNGDDLYGRRDAETLYNHLFRGDEEATVGYRLAEVIPDKGKTNRGIFQTNGAGYVKSIIETFDLEKNNLPQTGNSPDDLCSMNIFALRPEIIDLLQEKLEKFKREFAGDRKAECLLPVEISHLIEENKIKMKIYQAQDRWLGVTNPDDEEKVREKIKK